MSADTPPAHCLSTGVTSMIDAGSGGADNIAEFVQLAKNAPNRVRILVNLGRTGLGGRGELLDFAKPTRPLRDAPSTRIAMSSSASRRGCRQRGR
jgi:predicted amidohydrolase